jgi:uncharacterized protein YicC (UPF0701 family)
MAPRSMTGFARADGSEGAHYLTVELRSLNHRQLQLKSRFPRPCRASSRWQSGRFGAASVAAP